MCIRCGGSHHHLCLVNSIANVIQARSQPFNPTRLNTVSGTSTQPWVLLLTNGAGAAGSMCTGPTVRSVNMLPLVPQGCRQWRALLHRTKARQYPGAVPSRWIWSMPHGINGQDRTAWSVRVGDDHEIELTHVLTGWLCKTPFWKTASLITWCANRS
jgi:hypothetical protein